MIILILDHPHLHHFYSAERDPGHVPWLVFLVTNASAPFWRRPSFAFSHDGCCSWIQIYGPVCVYRWGDLQDQAPESSGFRWLLVMPAVSTDSGVISSTWVAEFLFIMVCSSLMMVCPLLELFVFGLWRVHCTWICTFRFAFISARLCSHLSGEPTTGCLVWGFYLAYGFKGILST